MQASAQTAGGTLLANATEVFFGVNNRTNMEEHRTGELRPTYEWQTVQPLQSVPAGLEIHLDLNGGGRLARIPALWRLQLYLGHAAGGYFRSDVQRDTTVGALERLATAQRARYQAMHHAGSTDECASFWSSAERLPPHATAEETSLFDRRGSLRVQWDNCTTPPATDATKPDGLDTHSQGGGVSGSMQLALVP